MKDIFGILIFFVALFGIAYIYDLFVKNSANDDIYTVDIFKNDIEICSKNIYIKDFTYNDELDLYELLNEIEFICRDYK